MEIIGDFRRGVFQHVSRMSKDFILQNFHKIKFYHHKSKIIFLVTACYFFLWSQKYQKSKTFQANSKMDIYKCPKTIFGE